MSTIYPDCVVELNGSDGNAVGIFMKVARELTSHLVAQGWDRERAEREAKRFKDEATSGDYDNVLITCHRWVTVI